MIASLEPCSDRSTEIALLLGALFASVESLQGHDSSTITHITCGMKVLQERGAQGIAVPGRYIQAGLLNSLFSRLSLQVLEIADMPMPVTTSTDHFCIPPLTTPINFSTIEEAQESFNLYIHKLLYIMSYVDGTLTNGEPLTSAQTKLYQATHATLEPFLQSWSGAFDGSLLSKVNTTSSSRHPCETRTQPGVHVLLMWRIIANILASLDPSKGETAWDPFINDFESIVDIAAIFIDCSPRLIPQDLTKYQPISLSTVSDRFRYINPRLDASDFQPLLAPIPHAS